MRESHRVDHHRLEQLLEVAGRFGDQLVLREEIAELMSP